MKKVKPIEESVAGKAYRLAGISRKEDYQLKKIFLGINNSDNWVKQQFPGTEIVQDMQSIIHDTGIDLVLIPVGRKDELNVVAEILQTGKNVRIV